MKKVIRRSLQAKTLRFYNEDIFYFATKQENPKHDLYVTFNRRWSFSASLSEAVLQDIDLIIKVQVHIDNTRRIMGRKHEFEKTRVQQTTSTTKDILLCMIKFTRICLLHTTKENKKRRKYETKPKESKPKLKVNKVNDSRKP